MYDCKRALFLTSQSDDSSWSHQKILNKGMCSYLLLSPECILSLYLWLGPRYNSFLKADKRRDRVWFRETERGRVWSHPAAVAPATFCSGSAGRGSQKARERPANGSAASEEPAAGRGFLQATRLCGGRGRSRSRCSNLWRPARTAFLTRERETLTLTLQLPMPTGERERERKCHS